MKSLQLLVPHEKCIYNCPFCISKTHKHDNSFDNIYLKDNDLWKTNLENVLRYYQDLKTIVITGTSEPTLNISCIQDMINIIRNKRSDIQIELQTRCYDKTSVSDDVDVLAYSIAYDSFLKKPYLSQAIIRYVILLTKYFEKYNLEELLASIPKEVSQVTFKVLHDSHGYAKNIDNWILENNMREAKKEELMSEVLAYKGDKSVRFDAESMKSSDRYMIFREDGKLYEDWESEEPVKRLLLF